jgi:hypothetical protein
MGVAIVCAISLLGACFLALFFVALCREARQAGTLNSPQLRRVSESGVRFHLADSRVLHLALWPRPSSRSTANLQENQFRSKVR